MASAEEDDIDLETLQAQIDRSVAFTNELVSSWIKPSLQSSSSRRTTEQEFEQLIRRPPRLGVGAPLPEATASTSRDTARLKGRLAGGKKRVREDYHVDQARSAEEDNEDESRAGAIKKKQKVDPFSLPKKKTKGQKTKRDDGEGTESAFSAGRDDAPAAHERDGRNMVAAHKTSPPASRGRIKDTISGRTPERKYKKRERGADDGSDRPVLYLDGPPPEPAEPSAENGAGARKKRKRRKKKNRKGEQGSDPGEEDRDVVMEDG